MDFLNEDATVFDDMLPITKSVLGEWSLFVNEDKTEYTQFYIAKKGELDGKGKPILGNEEWRVSKSLGSLLCSTADIKHRCQLGNFAFSRFKKVWLMGPKISLSKKLKVYEAQVTSVILYNCNSWATPKNILEKLDICQRKHLRQILKYRWPTVITNKTLYKRCKCSPLSERVEKSRWNMLGHVLRMTENSPAYLSLTFATEQFIKMKGRIGRHRANLFDIVKSDLARRNMSLTDMNDLYNLREIASDRNHWRKLFTFEETD